MSCQNVEFPNVKPDSTQTSPLGFEAVTVHSHQCRLAYFLFIVCFIRKMSVLGHNSEGYCRWSRSVFTPHCLIQKNDQQRTIIHIGKKKVKQYWYRPGHKGVKFVSPRHQPPLPRRIFVVLISIWVWVDPEAIVRPEGLSKKNSSDTVRNRTRILHAFSAVSSPCHRLPLHICNYVKFVSAHTKGQD